MTDPLRVYVDTNAFIRFVEADDPKLAAFFGAMMSQRLVGVSSELTRAEALVHPYRDENRPLIELYDQLLRDSAMLRIIPVSRVVLDASAELRATSGIKGADAIHIATARRESCSHILTDDAKMHLPDGLTRVPLDRANAHDNWTDL